MPINCNRGYIWPHPHLISKTLCAIHIKAVWCLFRTMPRKWNTILNEEIVCEAEQESCNWLDINHKMTAQSGQPATEFWSDSLYYILKVFCIEGHHFSQNNPSQIMNEEGIRSGRADCRRPTYKRFTAARAAFLSAVEYMMCVHLSMGGGAAQQWSGVSPRMSA